MKIKQNLENYIVSANIEVEGDTNATNIVITGNEEITEGNVIEAMGFRKDYNGEIL